MDIKRIAEFLLYQHEKRTVPEKPYSDYDSILSHREAVLEQFQPAFREVETLTPELFQNFLSIKHNHHWTGLTRSSGGVCDDMPKLQRAINHLFDEELPIAERLDDLTGKGPFAIHGLAEGTLTPLLLVRYPDRYGVWNGKSKDAMKLLGIWPNFARGLTLGEKYDLLNSRFRELSNDTGLDLWTLDALWHVIINMRSQVEVELAFEQLERNERAYYEGKLKSYSGIRVERDWKARSACVDFFGADCAVCGFNFEARYGELGRGFIHVHHREDLVLAEGEREVDPHKHLVPVCPNCHAMLHKGVTKSRTIEQLQSLLRPEVEKTEVTGK